MGFHAPSEMRALYHLCLQNCIHTFDKRPACSNFDTFNFKRIFTYACSSTNGGTRLAELLKISFFKPQQKTNRLSVASSGFEGKLLREWEVVRRKSHRLRNCFSDFLVSTKRKCKLCTDKVAKTRFYSLVFKNLLVLFPKVMFCF